MDKFSSTTTDLDNFSFALIKVEDTFNPRLPFSHVALSHKRFVEDGFELVVRFRQLFLFDPSRFSADLEHALVPLLMSAQSSAWGKEFEGEGMLLAELSEEILVPLFGEVAVDVKYARYVKNQSRVEAKHLGMGMLSTWHGTPDVRIQSCCMLTTSDSLFNDEEEESGYDDDDEQQSMVRSSLHCETPDSKVSASPSASFTSSILEEKQVLQKPDLHHLIAMAVVSSFVQNNNYPGENPLVPSLLISQKGFQICLYDCVNDFLLVSEVKNLVNKGKTITYWDLAVVSSSTPSHISTTSVTARTVQGNIS